GLVADPEVQYVHDDIIPEGYVVKSVPYQGRTVRQKRPVQLFISLGPEKILAPDLYLHTEEEARIILQELGLKINCVRECNDEIPEGKIFKQVTAFGLLLSRDEEVVVYVSSGSRPFRLSSLIGRTRDEAVSYLEQEGLNPRLRYETNEK